MIKVKFGAQVSYKSLKFVLTLCKSGLTDYTVSAISLSFAFQVFKGARKTALLIIITQSSMILV